MQRPSFLDNPTGNPNQNNKNNTGGTSGKVSRPSFLDNPLGNSKPKPKPDGKTLNLNQSILDSTQQLSSFSALNNSYTVDKNTPLVLNPLNFDSYEAIKLKTQDKKAYFGDYLKKQTEYYKKNPVKQKETLLPQFNEQGDLEQGKILRNIGTGFTSGVLSIPKAFDDTLDLLTGQQLNKDNWTERLYNTGQMYTELNNAKYQDDGGFISQLSSGIGQMGSFLVPSGIVGKVSNTGIKLLSGLMSKNSKLIPLIQKVAPNVAKLTASGTMIGLEAGMEMGQAYDEILERTGNVEDANKVATNVLISNAVLIGLTNKFSGYFDEMPSGVKKTVSRVLEAFFSEGGQEAGQSIISNLATGKEWSEGVKDAFLIGGIIGSGATLVTADIFKDSGSQAVAMDNTGERDGERGNQRPEIDLDKVKKVINATSETKKEILKAKKAGVSDEQIINDIVSSKNIDPITAQTVVETVKGSNNVLDAVDENSDEHKALLEDIRKAIQDGHKVSTISKVIQDQYGFTDKYATSVVASALSETENTQEQVAKEFNETKPKVEKVNKEVVKKEPTRLKIARYNPEKAKKGIKEMENVEIDVLGTGTIAGNDVFVHYDENIGTTVSEKTTGYMVGTSKYKSPKKAIEDVERQLRAKEKNKGDLEKEFVKAIASKEIINKTDIDTTENKADNKKDDKTIQRTNGNKRAGVSELVSTSLKTKGKTRKTSDRASKDVLPSGESDNRTADDSSKSDGERSGLDKNQPIEDIIKQGLNDILKTRKTYSGYTSASGKGDALEFSAINRGISGEYTSIEFNNAKKYLESAYVGKEVFYNDKHGFIISTPSFGKSKVEFDDGTIKSIDIKELEMDNITDQQVIDYIKTSSIKRAKSIITVFGSEEYKKAIEDTIEKPNITIDEKIDIENATEEVSDTIEAINDEIDNLSDEIEKAPEEVKTEITNTINELEDTKTEIENAIVDKVIGEKLTNNQIDEKLSKITSINEDGEIIITSNNKEEINDAINATKDYETGGVSKVGRGILDEYYTDTKIVEAVYSLLNLGDDIKVLEPSVGVGNFIPTNVKDVTGYEINKTTAMIAKVNNPNATIYNKSFETNFIDERGTKKQFKSDYDLVIGNPPYGDHRGIFKGLGEEETIKKYEEYFIKRGLDVVKDNGRVVLVVPSSFLKTQSNQAKLAISKLGFVESAYRLPEGVFDGTSVGTDIIILKKSIQSRFVPIRQEIVDNLIDDNYFKANPNNILGTENTRKNRFGDIETFIEGNIDDAISKLNELNIEKIAIGIAQDVGIENTPENIDKIKEVISESETNDVKDIIKEEETKNKEAENKQKVIDENRKKKVEEKIKRTSKDLPKNQVYLGDKQKVNFTDEELEHWNSRKQDGSLSIKPNPELASYYDGKWYMNFSYLQGNIYEKLEQLEKDKYDISKEQYEKQKKSLENIKPKVMPLVDIKLNANSSFLKDFKYSEDMTLAQSFLRFIRTLPNKVLGNLTYYDIDGYVRGEAVRGGSKDENARVRKYRSIVANNLLEKYLESIKEENIALYNSIEEAYNKQYNATHIPDYSEVPLTISINNSLNGKPFELTTVQQQGIGRLVEKGVGILAHDVGFGKTLTMILATYQNMQNGHTKRPLFSVPKATYTQWVNTILEVIPDAKINNLYNLADEYKGDLSSLKINDGEFSIVTEEGLKRISFKPETYEKYANKYSYATDDVNSIKTEREAQKSEEKTQETKGKMIRGTRDDLFFEDLGFDHIIVDEVHNANNIITKIKMPKDKATEFRAISRPANPSQYGVKTWIASQYIQDMNNGKNIYLGSATPFTNNPLQYFSILSLLANKTMKSMGVDNVNDFLNQFMDIEVRLEYKPNGTFSERQVIRNFKNFVLFRQLMGEYIDFKNGEDNPDLIRPTKLQRINNFGKSREYEEAELEIQANFSSSKDTLKLIGQLRALAISNSLLQGTKPNIADYKKIVESSPKLYAIAKNIGNNQRLNKKNNRVATELVYSPFGVEIFPILKQYLIKEEGLSPDEIEIITGETKPDKRTQIQNNFNGVDNDGKPVDTKLRVLIGTDTIGTGLNLQKRTSDIHFLGLPWNFTDLTQVEGRAWRQGNKWGNVRMNHYLMENSYDTLHFQILTSKQKRYELAIKNNENIVDVSDVDVEKQLSELITDPSLIAEIKLKEDEKAIVEDIRNKSAELGFLEKKIEKIANLDRELEAKKQNLFYSKKELEKENVSDYMRDYYEKSVKKYETSISELEEAIKAQKVAYEEAGINIKELDSKIEPLKSEISALNQKKDTLRLPETKKQYLEDAKKNLKPLKYFDKKDIENLINTYTKDNEDFYTLQVDKIFSDEVKEVSTSVEEVKPKEEKKVFYHGTLNKFDEFSLKFAGTNTSWENAKFGIFFLEDKEMAKRFIEENRVLGDERETQIKEVYLNIKNPIDLTTDGLFNNKKQAPVIVKLLGGEKMSEDDALEYINENIGLGDISDMYDDLYSDINNKKIMQKAGYDGIVSSFGKDDNGNIIKEWVAFEINQIEIIGKKETEKPKTPKTRTTKNTISKVPKELSIINDKSLTASEKVDRLLNEKQQGKEYKDVGERVSGSKKERATIKAIFKYGDRAMFDEVINQLGWESVFETIDKAEILEETGASNSIQVDYENKIPHQIAEFKKELINNIYRIPKLAGKKLNKWNWDFYTFKSTVNNTEEKKYSSIKSLSKEQLIEYAKVYPTTLKQLVKSIMSINTELPNILENKYIYTDALGNIVEENSQNMLYQIQLDAFGFNTSYGKSIKDRFRKINSGILKEGKRYYDYDPYIPLEFNADAYIPLLNPVKKDLQKSDDRHGNFDPIDEYEITDKEVPKDKVKAENLTKDYGFKTVQLGNYMDDASSYEHIQQTMGAIDSMSEALDIDLPKLISSKGLSIAYGARGGGKALAHYEPTKNIINMTKKRGDGSFAHEFMHFIDFTHYTRARGSKLSSLYSEGSRRYYIDDELGRKLMKLLLKGNYPKKQTYKPNNEDIIEKYARDYYYIKGEKVDIEPARFIEYVSKIINENKDDLSRIVNKSVYIIHPKYSEKFKDELFTMENWYSVDSPYSNDYVKIKPQLIANILNEEITVDEIYTQSDLYENALKMGGGKETYWSKKEELLARAFEAYIFDKMSEKGIKNSYAVRDNKAQTDNSLLSMAYPQGEERIAINKAFDDYFKDVRSKYPRGGEKYKLQGEVLEENTATGEFLKDVSERLNIDFDWKFFDVILSQYGQPAWGVTVNNKIGLSINAPFTTEYHEIVHLTLNNLDKIPVFNGIKRDELLQEQAVSMGLPKAEYNSLEVEESLAVGFEDYMSGKNKPKGKIATIFEYIKTQLDKFLKLIGIRKSIINEYYEILRTGNDVSDKFVDLSNDRDFTGFIENNRLDFMEIDGDPKFKKIDEVKSKYNELVEKISANKELSTVLSQYTDKASLDEISKQAHKHVENYVKSVLEIDNLKKKINNSSELFKKLIEQREKIEVAEEKLKEKLNVIYVSVDSVSSKINQPSETVILNAVETIAQDVPEENTIDIIKASTPKKIEKKGKKISAFQHRMLDMLSEVYKEDVYYDPMSQYEEVAKAEMYYEKNKKRTIDIALGREQAPEGVSTNMISLVAITKLNDEGKSKQVAEIMKKLTSQSTKFGQEISMLRNAFGMNDPKTYMKKVLEYRKMLARRKFKPMFTSLKSVDNVEDIIKKKQKEAKEKNLNLQDMITIKTKEIDNFLDSITC